jgi:hypothetical protein
MAALQPPPQLAAIPVTRGALEAPDETQVPHATFAPPAAVRPSAEDFL